MSIDATPNRIDDTPIQALPDEFDSLIGISLADAIREGSKITTQAHGWGNGTQTACALTAAGICIRDKGFRFDGEK